DGEGAVTSTATSTAAPAARRATKKELLLSNGGNVSSWGTTSGGGALQWLKSTVARVKSAGVRVVVGLGGYGDERRERWRLGLG
ncbi:hypothetical protein PIB30_104092, partial [Stylosanthes scabra]|nr:hypothetical protein [Stylosanthes scabra]